MASQAGGKPPQNRPRAVISWSSGKDSAYALHLVRLSGQFDVIGLLTTVTEQFGRVSMHGVREELLQAQAKAVGLPLHQVEIPYPCPNVVYEQRMEETLAELRTDGVTHLVFGDLFLQDIRDYREKKLAAAGFTPVFPLWGRNTSELVREMLRAGIQCIVVCVDPRRLPSRFAGRWLDDQLLAEFPSGVDPCGENGEFHTFVAAGPMFRHSIPIRTGTIVERDGFVFSDLLPADLRAR